MRKVEAERRRSEEIEVEAGAEGARVEEPEEERMGARELIAGAELGEGAESGEVEEGHGSSDERQGNPPSDERREASALRGAGADENQGDEEGEGEQVVGPAGEGQARQETGEQQAPHPQRAGLSRRHGAEDGPEQETGASRDRHLVDLGTPEDEGDDVGDTEDQDRRRPHPGRRLLDVPADETFEDENAEEKGPDTKRESRGGLGQIAEANETPGGEE